MDNRMSIVFIGFDGYSDMWDDCIGLIKRFWKDCPYKIMFINNEKKVNWEGIEVVNAGKEAEWSRKVQIAIEKCNTPYICLLLEDFLVGSEINTDEVRKTVDFIETENIQYYKINMHKGKIHDPKYKNSDHLHIIPQYRDYGISLQPAIWNKQYLIKLVGQDNYNAWTFEFNRVKESYGKGKEPHDRCVFDENNILNLKHGVIQSQYLPDTVKYFKKIGINLNIEREIMSYFSYYKRKMIGIGKG